MYPASSPAVLGLAVWLLVLAINALIVKSLQLVLLQFDRFKCSIASTVFTFCNAREGGNSRLVASVEIVPETQQYCGKACSAMF